MSLISVICRAAQIRPNGVALIDAGHSIRWGELPGRVARIAGSLRGMGLVPGSRVGTLALNSSMHFELLLAVWWCGGVLVPLNTRLAEGEIRYMLDHAGATLLLADAEMAGLAACAADKVPLTVMDAATRIKMLAGQAVGAASVGYEETVAIFYTGGTTGLPKGVELSQRNFAFAAAGMLRDLQLGPDSVYLHAAPMFHLADFGVGLGVSMGAGTHSFLARFTPEDLYLRLREDGVTHLNLVPTMLAALLDSPARDDRLLAQVTHISYGATSITPALLERVLLGFPNAAINQFYGMTECCGASVFLSPERHVLEGAMAGKLKAAGQAIPGFELLIVGPDGQTVPAGVTGEILIRGVSVMKGYWNDSVQTAAAMPDGWLHSGDGGYLDADGFLYVVDRIKDMIVSGGENIYCSEVESALASHPAVQACAVLGLPDDKWGERVHAVVVCKGGAAVSVDALHKHMRSRIAGYKMPKSYEFVESLPLSGVGKVQKKVLREQCLQRVREHHE